MITIGKTLTSEYDSASEIGQCNSTTVANLLHDLILLRTSDKRIKRLIRHHFIPSESINPSLSRFEISKRLSSAMPNIRNFVSDTNHRPPTRDHSNSADRKIHPCVDYGDRLPMQKSRNSSKRVGARNLTSACGSTRGSGTAADAQRMDDSSVRPIFLARGNTTPDAVRCSRLPGVSSPAGQRSAGGRNRCRFHSGGVGPDHGGSSCRTLTGIGHHRKTFDPRFATARTEPRVGQNIVC